MAIRPTVKLTRQQIYDEVWSSAVSGMAMKYSIPYSAMLKQIKDAGIPIPPPGYWTKKEFDKETTITELNLRRRNEHSTCTRRTANKMGL